MGQAATCFRGGERLGRILLELAMVETTKQIAGGDHDSSFSIQDLESIHIGPTWRLEPVQDTMRSGHVKH